MPADRRESAPIEPRLGVWDATSLVVGIIIGVGIFQTPASVFNQTPHVVPALLTWLIGGVLALIGAFCFAELASSYPRSGGEYNYLTRAFGPLCGFIYAWTQLSIIRPASIGAVAYIFAIHARSFFQVDDRLLLAFALGAIGLLTGVNILGVTLGKNTNNVLTAVKVIGLVGILVIGIGWGNAGNLRDDPSFATVPFEPGWFASAMILVLWTYSGWHEAAYIASEVRDNRRNLPRALIAGTLLVTVLYLAVNLALILGLGVQGAMSDSAAADLAALAFPIAGRGAMSVLIMICALGALNGMIFTTARIAVAFGEDHSLFRPLTVWNPTLRTPARALVVEGFVSIAFVVGVFVWARMPKIGEPGAKQENPFDSLVDVTAAIFWVLFLLTGVALMILRSRDAELPRPFKTPAYPLLPVVFCAWCAYMVVGASLYARWLTLVGVSIAAVGLPLYYLQKRPKRVRQPDDQTCGVA